jgi:hypothetical protein
VMEKKTHAITAQQVRDDSLRGATASPITPKPQNPKTPKPLVLSIENLNYS